MKTVLSVVAGAVVAAGLVAAGLLPLPVLVMSLPFVVIAARKPVLRRLAVRNATRRPRETVLVLLGALLGTAIITGSAIVGDTLAASIRRSAFTQLGPVDELVLSTGTDSADRIRAAVDRLPRTDIDGVLSLTSLTVAVATPGSAAGSSGSGQARAEPTARLIEVDFAEAAAFGGDPEATGISGPTPTGDSAVLGQDLARTLDVEPGASVEVYAYGQKRTFRVDRLVPRLGVAGLSLAEGSESPTIFVPPGFIAETARLAPAGAAPPTAMVAVSNKGGVIDGAASSERVRAQITQALGDLPASTSIAKKDLLRVADEQGKQFTQLFSSIGFFSVLAGILLLVNIFVMLAQERKTSLGMLRAVGLRRSGLVGSFSIEGWLYALAASALGTVAGLGVGRLIVIVAAGIFAAPGGGPGLELRYAATLQSIQGGFLTGFVMSMVTVVATALWIARLNVIRAIRDLPDPTVTRQRVIWSFAGALATVVGGAMTVAGFVGDDPFLILAGPSAAAIGLVPLLRRVAPRRTVVTAVSAGVLLWAVGCFDLAPDAFKNPPISIFVTDGIILSAAAVALVSQNQDIIGSFVRRLGGGSRSMSLRLGLAYPLARRFRTGMILTMYALVVFTLASITLFSSVFSGQIDKFEADISGGFDLRVDSNPSSPVPADELRREPGVRAVASLLTVEGEFRTKNTEGRFEPAGGMGFDQDFVDEGPPALVTPPAGQVDDRAAYRSLLSDPSQVIVSEFFLQDGGGPPEASLKIGDMITMSDPRSGRSRDLRVAAIGTSGFDRSPAVVSSATLREVFGAQAVPNQSYVATEPGVDPQQVAEAVKGRFLANGAHAVSFRKSVSDGLASQGQFFRLMQGYLALGLVVGIAGLGVVMVRAVRERRRQVGVLRSLGFEAGQVRRAFLAESAFVALEGILVGVGLALVSTWRLLSTGSFGDGLAFHVPWLQLTVLVVVTFLASLLATAVPAQQASRIRPALALRIAD